MWLLFQGIPDPASSLCMRRRLLLMRGSISLALEGREWMLWDAHTQGRLLWMLWNAHTHFLLTEGRAH